MSTAIPITDAYGRTITPQPSADGLTVAYQVTGTGQNFTQTFPASTPQATAIACIEAGMPTLLVPVPTIPVPQTVSRYQAMAAMSQTPSATNPAPATLLSDVTAAVTAAGGLVLLAWQNTSSFDRNGQFVTQIGAQLGLTSAQLDQLFIAAAQITS